MADRRPVHRKGTTGKAYRKAQQALFNSASTCARCGGSVRRDIRCNHPKHQHLRYCPTHPLAPSYGHKTDLQHGGSVRGKHNRQLEHFGCNSRAGARSQRRNQRLSWDW